MPGEGGAEFSLERKKKKHHILCVCSVQEEVPRALGLFSHVSIQPLGNCEQNVSFFAPCG